MGIFQPAMLDYRSVSYLSMRLSGSHPPEFGVKTSENGESLDASIINSRWGSLKGMAWGDGESLY